MLEQWRDAFDAEFDDTPIEDDDYYCSDCGRPADPPGRGQTSTATGQCKSCWWQDSETLFITTNGVYRKAAEVWVVTSDGNPAIGGAAELFSRSGDGGGEVFITGLDKVQLAAFLHDAENAVMRNVKRFDARQWQAERKPMPATGARNTTGSLASWKATRYT